jgi:hypothetical protein
MGSIWVTMGVFAIALVLLHAFMYYRKKAPIFWKCTEYFWLIVGLLGLIAAAAEARKLIAGNNSWLVQGYYEGRLSDARRQALFDVEMCRQNRGLYLGEWGTAKIDKSAAEQYGQAALWFQRILDELKMDRNKIEWTGSLLKDAERIQENHTAPWSPAEMISKDKVYFSGFLKRLHTAADELAANEQAAKRSEFEAILTLFGPWLLAVAFAVRITAVSAGLKGYT